MRVGTALLLVTGLVVGALAAAPTASAGLICDAISNPPQACYLAEGIVEDVRDYALCYYNTPPSQWGRTCL